MAEFKKQCKECGTVFEYDQHDQLSEWFYKKDGFYLRTCKKCELKKHAEKYKKGIYRNNKRDRSYDPHDYRGV